MSAPAAETRPPADPSADTLAALRARYRSQRQALLDDMRACALPAAPASRLPRAMAALARLADETLAALWQRAGLPGALAAVGGYGRSELFPFSDVDVLVLLPDEAGPPASLDAAVSAFVAACWDVGLEVSHSVRTVAQCLQAARQDITACTAWLEARRVAGDAALLARFEAAFAAQLDPLAFLAAKQLEQRQRHARQQDTPYALEPDCKESPGGLRDLHTIRWVARAAGFGRSWADLARSVATAREARQLARNERLLWLIRARLHLLAGRHEDRLVFERQAAVAAAFGYENRFDARGRLAQRASEQLMRRYYWCAKAVVQLSEILLQVMAQRLRAARETPPPARRINAWFSETDGALDINRDDLYQRHPRAILQTFWFYQSRPEVQSLGARTLRALYNARAAMDGRFRADPANHALFMRMLKAPAGQTHALRLMNRTSVLGRYLWVFRRIVGQMQHDLFHVYTVDQHTLMVLGNMRRFFMPEFAHEYPLCSQLAQGWQRPWVLYVAALFHDIAKGRGGDHSELGAREVRRFCRQMGIHGDDAALAEFLVREHLGMSQVAQKQDVSDPAVIARFAARVQTQRRLAGLYLLTVADIRGTSPKVWNGWKDRLLQDLYHATARHLGGHAASASALAASRQRQALALLPAGGPAAARSPWAAPAKSPGTRKACSMKAAAQPKAAPSSPRAAPPAARACKCWFTRPTSPTFSRAFAGGFTARACPFTTRAFTPAAAAGRWTPSRSAAPTPWLARQTLAKPTNKRPPRPHSSPACKRAWRRPLPAAPRCPPCGWAASPPACAAFPSRPMWNGSPTTAASAGGSASRPATALACSTASAACWPRTASAWNWPASAPWASAPKTPSCCTAPIWPMPACKCKWSRS